VFDLDMYIGIGGVVTYKQTELREVLAKVGLSRVVLETDSPYLPPVPHRGKRNEPSWLTEVVHAIAQACRCHPQHVIESTFQNALTVYPKLQN
jgi:TatD DNase family protein